jgi:hypothetical protein
MDFGTLKNKFTEAYIESHLNEDQKGKELYKRFLEVLKESETLKTYFIVYKNLEGKTASNEFEATEYLKENLSLLEKFRGEKSIVNESKKLINLLENNDIDLGGEPTEFNKSLHILTTNQRNVNNINSIHESKLNVVKHLMEDKTKVNNEEDLVRENIDVNKFLNIATEKYNEKYSTLTEEEKTILKIIREGNDTDKEGLLRSMVKETISLVNERLKSVNDNISLKAKLLETKDVVYSMDEYDSTTFSENIKRLYDIKSVF